MKHIRCVVFLESRWRSNHCARCSPAVPHPDHRMASVMQKLQAAQTAFGNININMSILERPFDLTLGCG